MAGPRWVAPHWLVEEPRLRWRAASTYAPTKAFVDEAAPSASPFGGRRPALGWHLWTPIGARAGLSAHIARKPHQQENDNTTKPSICQGFGA